MPRLEHAVILALLATGCTPSRFGWHDGTVDLRDYRAAFERSAGDRFTAATTTTGLLAGLSQQRVLWLGDHHGSERLHRRQRELLAALLRTGQRPVLALEAIGTQDEAAVADYLAGHGDEFRLLTVLRRRWPSHWLEDAAVDAPHWRELLRMARAHQLPVHALEPTPRLPLAERDRAIAANVTALAAAYPSRLIVVWIGQAHLRGRGDLVARVGLPATILGGEPVPALLAAPTTGLPPAALRRSDGGLWWFTDLLPGGPGR
jgi:Haem-binding uptake, Tiki superfamily, ChaN